VLDYANAGVNEVKIGSSKSISLLQMGRLKTRDLTSRDHQNCGDWHCETGQRETM